MRVTLDARVATDHFPGIGRVAVQLAGALARRLPPDELLTLAPSAGAASRFGALGGECVPCADTPFALAQQWRIPRQLARLRTDVYHSLYFGMPFLPGRPTVWTCHDLIPLVVPGVMDPARRFAYLALHRLAARAARRIVADSAATRADLARFVGVPEERITVVPLGIDERFRSVPGGEDGAGVARAAALVGVALPERYLLHVGINKPHKNLVRLVRAVARAQAAAPARDLTLVIAGPWDPRYPEARAAVRDAGIESRVRFLGPIADEALPALYAGALAFVFPSLYEGFGLPVLEALAAGAPTITSRRSSLPEVAGDAALLVDPEDELALADAIGRLADDAGLRAELRARGRRRAAEFTWERVADAMIEIYRAVAGAPRTAEAR